METNVWRNGLSGILSTSGFMKVFYRFEIWIFCFTTQGIAISEVYTFLKNRKGSKIRISAVCSFQRLLAVMGRDLRKAISYDNVNTFHPQEEKVAASIFIVFRLCSSLVNPVIIIFSPGFPTGRTWNFMNRMKYSMEGSDLEFFVLM